MIRVRAECDQLLGSEHVKTFETDFKRSSATIELERCQTSIQSLKVMSQVSEAQLFAASLPSPSDPCSGQAAVASQQVANVRPPPRLREHETWAYISEDTYVPVKR